MLFQIGQVVALGPVVRVIVQETEIATVGFLPVCEPYFHGLEYPISGNRRRVIISEANAHAENLARLRDNILQRVVGAGS